jgi:iron(III) transport system ATP-binding protein
MARLQVTHLAKYFTGAEILRDVNLTVESGMLVAILGASGGGKTTLLRLIAGFDRPDAGEITLAGEVLAGSGVFLRPEQRGIGYVAQEGALFPHLSVADNITFGLPRAARRARHRVTELLTMVDLPAAYADRAPQALSGGEQQRIALARALAPSPKLVLLDEPFSALDAGLRAETRLAVAAAIKAAGATAILVTHDQAEALSMGSMVGVLQNGILAQLSAPEALYRTPGNPALADFIGEAVFTTGTANAGTVHCALGELHLGPGAPEGRVEVMVRPEQIKINPASGHGAVPAVVENVTFYGHDAVVRLNLKDALSSGSAITARVFSHAVPRPGSDVWLSVEGEVVAFAMPPLPISMKE